MIEKVCAVVLRAASLTVTEPDENVSVLVGVPVKATLFPLTTAVSPVGRPLDALSV